MAVATPRHCTLFASAQLELKVELDKAIYVKSLAGRLHAGRVDPRCGHVHN